MEESLMNEEERYDLNESAKGIGQLYPVLVDKKGRVIDGFHRLQADPKWRVQPLDHIDSDEKLLLARCIANWHRRQVSREEKAEWINGLAEIYKKQGLKVSPINEVKAKIMDGTKFAERTISRYLSSEYKAEFSLGLREGREPRVPASQVIEKQFETERKGYGKQLVERHREEVLAEEKPKIEQQVKAELLASPKFREEVFKRDLEERYEKAKEERGVDQIWDVQKIDEAQDVIDEFSKVAVVVQGWGVNQYVILKKFNRLQEAYEIVDRIQDKLRVWRMTKYV